MLLSCVCGSSLPIGNMTREQLQAMAQSRQHHRKTVDGRLCAAAFVQNRQAYAGCVKAPSKRGATVLGHVALCSRCYFVKSCGRASMCVCIKKEAALWNMSSLFIIFTRVRAITAECKMKFGLEKCCQEALYAFYQIVFRKQLDVGRRSVCLCVCLSVRRPVRLPV